MGRGATFGALRPAVSTGWNTLMRIGDRDMVLRELRMLKDTLRASKFKRLADDADLLLQSVLDLGMGWTVLYPEIQQFKVEVAAHLSGRRSLPSPT